MRIVIAHSPYASGPASGENQVVADESRLLEEAGHEVIRWSPASATEDGRGRVTAAASAVWARQAGHELRALLRTSGAEVVHFHNLFPAVSPAALRVARDAGAGVLMTLHNFRLLCLPATFLRDGRACEDCLGRVPWRGVVHRCYRQSAAASAALATSITLHRAVRSFDSVDVYLAVSQLVRSKHLQAGFPADRVVVKPNFAWPASAVPSDEPYVAYVGRLSEEKGIDRLVSAWRDVPVRLVVAGDGPLREAVTVSAPQSVEFTGLLSPEAALAVVGGAGALAVPSRCYEGQPRSVLEAYAAGVPVIAARTEGLAEVVDDGVTGVLVDGERGWRAGVEQVLEPHERARLGRGARKAWEARYSPDAALDALEAAYKRAIERHR